MSAHSGVVVPVGSGCAKQKSSRSERGDFAGRDSSRAMTTVSAVLVVSITVTLAVLLFL